MSRQIIIEETEDGQINIGTAGNWPKITEILGALELSKAILLSKQMRPAEQSPILAVKAGKFGIA